MSGRVLRIAEALVLAGFASLVGGAWLLAPWLGCIVFGTLAVTAGVALVHWTRQENHDDR
jgi:hypothetical protein